MKGEAKVNRFPHQFLSEHQDVTRRCFFAWVPAADDDHRIWPLASRELSLRANS